MTKKRIVSIPSNRGNHSNGTKAQAGHQARARLNPLESGQSFESRDCRVF